MSITKFPLRLIGAAVLSLGVTAAHAALSLTTATGANTATAYLTSLTGSGYTGGIDSFNDLIINDPALGTSLTRTAGPVGYTVSTETNLYAVQANGIGGPALSVDANTDTLTFSGFSTPVYAFGARFFLSDLSYGVNSGLMTVTATEIGGTAQTFTFNQTVSSSTSGATEPVFFKLGSTLGLQSVQLIAPAPGSNPLVFATADTVVMAVPEPGAVWLMLCGLIGLTLYKRRSN